MKFITIKKYSFFILLLGAVIGFNQSILNSTEMNKNEKAIQVPYKKDDFKKLREIEDLLEIIKVVYNKNFKNKQLPYLNQTIQCLSRYIEYCKETEATKDSLETYKYVFELKKQQIELDRILKKDSSKQEVIKEYKKDIAEYITKKIGKDDILKTLFRKTNNKILKSDRRVIVSKILFPQGTEERKELVDSTNKTSESKLKSYDEYFNENNIEEDNLKLDSSAYISELKNLLKEEELKNKFLSIIYSYKIEKTINKIDKHHQEFIKDIIYNLQDYSACNKLILMKDTTKHTNIKSSAAHIFDQLKLENIFYLLTEVTEIFIELKAKPEQRIEIKKINSNHIDSSFPLASFDIEYLDNFLDNPWDYLEKGILSTESQKNIPNFESHIYYYLEYLLNTKNEEKAVKFIKNIISEVKKKYALNNNAKLKKLNLFKNRDKKQPNDIIILNKRDEQLNKMNIFKFINNCAKLFHNYKKYYLVIILINWNHLISAEIKTVYNKNNNPIWQLTGWHILDNKQDKITNKEIKTAKKYIPIKGLVIGETSPQKINYTIELKNEDNGAVRISYGLENKRIKIKKDKNTEDNINLINIISKMKFEDKLSDMFPTDLEDEELSDFIIKGLYNGLNKDYYNINEQGPMTIIGFNKQKDKSSSLFISYVIDKKSKITYSTVTIHPMTVCFEIETEEDIEKIANKEIFLKDNKRFTLNTFTKSIKDFLIDIRKGNNYHNAVRVINLKNNKTVININSKNSPSKYYTIIINNEVFNNLT